MAKQPPKTLTYDAPFKTLLIDIETAPAIAYIWGLKTRYVPLSQIDKDGYILCFAAGWLGSEELEFWSEWDQGPEAMAWRAWELLDEADAIIHYNGNSFDIPRLNAEFFKFKFGPPSPSHQVDLYRTVSQNFRVLSKSMQHMLKMAGHEGKLDHKGMALWTEVMAGDQEARDTMEEYNIKDVTELENLYGDLRPWIKNAPNEALWMEPGIEPRCRCGSTDLRFKGYKRTTVLSYRQYHCQSCGAYPRSRIAEERGANRRYDILT
jgi:hypothetical protein